MHRILTLAVRIASGLTYAMTAVAVVWALGFDSQPAPHTGVLVCVWAAAGSAAARATLLWIRQVYGGRRSRPAVGSGVSLEKASDDDLDMWALGGEVPYASEGWVKVRQLLANAALLAASLTAVTLPSLPGQDSLPAALQRAGSEVGTATVAEQPHVVRKEYDDDNRDLVVGYYSNLRVSVPGASGSLAVGPVRSDKPFQVGSPITVLWSPGNPALGGYADSPDELRRLAEGKWEVSLAPGGVRGGLSVMIAWIFGLCMLPWVVIFALGFDEDMLDELAWSPLTQTAHALVFLAAAYGYTPALTGHEANRLQVLLQLGGWFLLAGLIFTPVLRVIREG